MDKKIRFPKYEDLKIIFDPPAKYLSKTTFTIKSEKINFILEQNFFNKSCSK